MSAAEHQRPKWLRWLHRAGYVATALIVAELILTAIVATRGSLQSREMRAKLVEESRTHETPLQPTDDRWVRGGAIELLHKLIPISALHGNGIRFVAMPSFGKTEYGVVLSLPPSNAPQANGILTTIAKQEDQGTILHRDFVMPAVAYRSLISKIDKLTDDWPGGAGDLCLDGTPTASSGCEECASRPVSGTAAAITSG